jgi:AcrR family transcriptional regulator
MENRQSNTPPKDTRSKIMQAASDLFTTKGYAGTTTRAIADSAGVNEVTLFRHFGTKENLAREIMHKFGGQAVAGNMKDLLSGDYRKDLILIGNLLLRVMTEKNDVMRMAICEAGHFPEFRDIVAENPRQLREMLAGYFQTQINQGIIRPGHPQLMAQAFLGMFFSYTVLQGFLLDDLEPGISKQDLVNGFVDLFIHGTISGKE